MIQGHYNRSLLLLPVFVIVGLCLSCTNEDKPLKTEWKEKYDVELPIIEQVNQALFEGATVESIVRALMTRDKKAETDYTEWD